MARALSASEVLNMKKQILPFKDEWYDAFGEPEATGIWFVWGNSGNGKTSFVMQLCKQLCQYGKTIYNSLEEGVSLSMKNALQRYQMNTTKSKFQILDCENWNDFKERLRTNKRLKFAVIDSFQYIQITYPEYIKFKEENRNRLIIFVSHADGRSPSGRTAKSVMYDATLKIWVEGHRAQSKGRFIGANGGNFIIWDEGNKRYGGN